MTCARVRRILFAAIFVFGLAAPDLRAGHARAPSGTEAPAHRGRAQPRRSGRHRSDAHVWQSGVCQVRRFMRTGII
jgi:hypothetical protein